MGSIRSEEEPPRKVVRGKMAHRTIRQMTVEVSSHGASDALVVDWSPWGGLALEGSAEEKAIQGVVFNHLKYPRIQRISAKETVHPLTGCLFHRLLTQLRSPCS